MEVPGFHIKRTIGKGGMATVYLATQAGTGRSVVLKTLEDVAREPAGEDETTQFPDGGNRLERFLNEGRIASTLQHPNIVETYDFGRAGEVVYIAMDYMEGGDLRNRMDAPLPPREALDVVIRVGGALEYAHAKGIIHRDVKTANIMFTDTGVPKLGDFGIAKQLDEDMELTSTGTTLGSPYYMSPEQAQGQTLDGRTDIYSLGIILYEMLTGMRPYLGDTAISVVLQHIRAPVPKLPGPLEAFQPLLESMLAKRPAERFANTHIMLERAGELRGMAMMISAAPPPAEATAEVNHPNADTRTMDALQRAALPALRDDDLEAVSDRVRNGILEDLACDRLVLPSLPDVALKVRTALENPNISGAQVARIVTADPALAAQVLRIANSAYYASSSPVSDLQRAVVRLGYKAVQHVVMLLVTSQLYNARARPRIREHMTRLWRHCTLVASISDLLARRYTSLQPEVALLGGLIHDVGVLPILVWAEKMPHLLTQPRRLWAIAYKLHAELGEAILREWRLPQELVDIAAQHENLDRNPGTEPDLVDVVLVANLMSRAGSEHPLAEVDWASVPAMERLGIDPGAAADIMAEAGGRASLIRDLLH